LIVVQKGARQLLLYEGGRLVAAHRVALGHNATADKCVEGDGATPLGDFYVCARNPESRFFRSLCLSYPNEEDAERGLADGLITPAEHAQILEALRARRMPPQHTRLGGEIYIHGEPAAGAAHTLADWTHGCIALDNAAMLELYDRVALGTAVRIER
jgi:murein L,D-transpeptidase YafK